MADPNTDPTASPVTTAPPTPAPIPGPATQAAPSIGRIVHVNRSGKPPLAAIVVGILADTCVHLVVFGDGDTWEDGSPASVSSRPLCSVELGTSPGTWCWPPRV